MIRLLKLFKRNPKAETPIRGLAGIRRTNTKLPPRSFQRAQESEDLALTEDPEQQRARHRLIGAAVLVLIAVIGLPRILDNKPKSVNNDIAVNIVTSLPLPLPNTPMPEERAKVTETVAKEKDVSVTKDTLLVAPTPITDAKPEAKPEAKLAPLSKSNGLGLAAGEEVIASNPKPKAEEIPKKLATSGKFVIQIGAFASEERAKGWIAKMKEQKIPNYVINKTSPDGTKLFVLRAGPFLDKDTAESAERKVKALGLSPRLVEIGAP